MKPACEAGAAFCEGDGVKRCAADRSAWELVPCGLARTCTEATCVNQLCEPGDKFCQDGRLHVCAPSGVTTTVAVDCLANGDTCTNNACKPATCKPHETGCAGNGRIGVCDAIGYDWIKGEQCQTWSSQICHEGECRRLICEPGKVFCDGTRVNICDKSGTGPVAKPPIKDCANTGEHCMPDGSCAKTVCQALAFRCIGNQLDRCHANGGGWVSWSKCYDGDACTTDACDAEKQVCRYIPIKCDDGDVCTNNKCDKGNCEFGAIVPPGAKCEDGDACTTFTRCDGGKCKSPAVGSVVVAVGTGQPGFADGSDAQARFNKPQGIAHGESGAMLIADTGNHRIRRWLPGKGVTTIAGTGFSGYMDGPISIAQLDSPTSTLLLADGRLLIADQGNYRLRILHKGVLSTLAGGNKQYITDGNGLDAQLDTPRHLRLRENGNVLFLDYRDLRELDPAGNIRTISGRYATGYYSKGPAWSVRFSAIEDIAVDGHGGVLCVAEAGWDSHPGLYVVTAAEYVYRLGTDLVKPPIMAEPGGTILVGSAWVLLQRLAPIGGAGSPFYSPFGLGTSNGVPVLLPDFNTKAPSNLLAAGDGSLLAIDTGHHRVVRLQELLTTCDDRNPCTVDLCDQSTAKCQHKPAAKGAACEDGDLCTSKDTCDGAQSCKAGKAVVCGDGNECTKDACDAWSGQCRLVARQGECFAGSACNLFRHCSDTACVVGTIPSTVLAGRSSIGGYKNGGGVGADGWPISRFSFTTVRSSNIVRDRDGLLWIADTNNGALRTLDTKGYVRTGVQSGFARRDGRDFEATVSSPTALALDPAGSLHWVDDRHVIRRRVDGWVQTLCGGAKAFKDGPCATAGFGWLAQIAFDAKGDMIVADQVYRRIRRVSRKGIVTTIVGNGQDGYKDGSFADAIVGKPAGVAVLADGNIIISDAASHRLRKLLLGQKLITTIAGSGKDDTKDGSVTEAAFTGPATLEHAPGGGLYVVDAGVRLFDGSSVKTLVQPWSYITDTSQDRNVSGVASVPSGGLDYYRSGAVVRLQGAAKGCDDSEPCTVDSCDAKTAECHHKPAKPGAACDDGTACTSGDACDAGGTICRGTPKSCVDGILCTHDACDGVDGSCLHFTITGPCDDGNACTLNENCSTGVCTATKHTKCDDGSPCTQDACDPKTGKCVTTPEKNGTACADGSACHETDTCINGVCTLGPDGNGGKCSDGDGCTTNDVCKAGKCEAGGPLPCGAQKTCFKGFCYAPFPSAMLTGAHQKQLAEWTGAAPTQTWKRCFWTTAAAADTGREYRTNCASKAPSITLIRVSGGRIFGQYFSKTWYSNSGGPDTYLYDNSAFFFSLDRNIKVPITYGSPAFWVPGYNRWTTTKDVKGPVFGNTDVVVETDLKTGKMALGKAYSTAKMSCTGSCDSWIAGTSQFSVKEIEVFYRP